MLNILCRHKKTLLVSLSICFMMIAGVLIFPDIAASQPPFPMDNPEQSPIDGGLGILAALGGTYAIKKLRDKKE